MKYELRPYCRASLPNRWHFSRSNLKIESNVTLAECNIRNRARSGIPFDYRFHKYANSCVNHQVHKFSFLKFVQFYRAINDQLNICWCAVVMRSVDGMRDWRVVIFAEPDDVLFEVFGSAVSGGGVARADGVASGVSSVVRSATAAAANSKQSYWN